MQVFLFFALIIAILAIIFAVQNNSTTEVSFFLWQFKGSLALVLLVSMAVGALISFLASLPTNIRVRWAFRNQRKRLSEIEASLEEHKQKLEDAQNKLEQAVQPPEVEKETPQEPQPEDETQA